MMLTKKTLFFLMMLFLPFASYGQKISIATGHTIGIYYPVGERLCQLLIKEAKKAKQVIDCEVVETHGSINNLKLLTDYSVSVAIAQSNWQYHAYHGSRLFAMDGGNKHLRALFSLHEEPFTLLTRKEAQIATFSDLKNKRINIGEPGKGAASHGMLEALMRSQGMTMSDFAQITHIDSVKQYSALCRNETDAVLYAVGHPNKAIEQGAQECELKLIPLKKSLIERLVAEHAYFSYAVIPGGMYAGNPQDTETVSMRATVIATDAMSEQTAYLLTKAAFENVEALRSVQPALSQITPQTMLQGNTAPFHEGSRKYFSEKLL